MKYKLKAMPNTVVNLRTQEEYDEYGKMCDDAGWTWFSGNKFSECYSYSSCGGTCISVRNKFSHCSKDYYEEKGCKVIILDELKSQLDYEYEVGDILCDRKGSYKFKILHEWNGYYITSECDDYDSVDDNEIYTKEKIEDSGFKLWVEPKEPEINEISLKDIADKFNIPLDKLRIKE